MRETVWRNGSRELNNNREADPVSGPDSRELTPRGGSNFQPRCDECVHKDFSTEDKFQVPAKYAKVLHARIYRCWLLYLTISRSTTTSRPVRVARPGKSAKVLVDAVGSPSFFLELCETTVVQVCV